MDTLEIETVPKGGEPMNDAQKLTVLSVFIGVAFSIGTLLWTVFGAYHDIQDLKRDVADHRARLSNVEEMSRSNTRIAEEAAKTADTAGAKMDRIDHEGTQASQRGIYQESDFSHATEKRVSAIEKAMAEMAPKLERIDVNLQWMLQQQGSRPTVRTHP